MGGGLVGAIGEADKISDENAEQPEKSDLQQQRLLPNEMLNSPVPPLEASYIRALRRNFAKDLTTGQWGQVRDEKLDPADVYTKGGSVAEVPAIYAGLGEIGRSNPWITLNALRALKSAELST